MRKAVHISKWPPIVATTTQEELNALHKELRAIRTQAVVQRARVRVLKRVKA